MPKRWSSLSAFSSARISDARASATPPPGTMPSSTAARVACKASSTRSLRSFTSTSVAPPTLMTATPPAENNGKHLLIGVYPGDIYVSDMPFQLPLRLWVSVVTPSEEEFLLRLRISFDGKKLGMAELSFKTAKAEEAAFGLPLFAIKGTELGEILVEAEDKDNWEVILKKQ